MVRARGAGASKGLWAAGVVLVAVVLLTVYAMVTGGDDQDAQTPAKGGASTTGTPTAAAPSSPEATYAPPDDWTEPERWASLPRGKRTDERGNPVGFPHTVEGGVAMAVAANTTTVEGETSSVDEQMRLYYSYLAQSDRSAKGREYTVSVAKKTDRDFERAAGAPSGGPLPAGAYMRNNVIGYKVIKSTGDEIALWVLARATQKNGELAKETGSYTRTLIGIRWVDGDWKLSAEVTARAMSQTGTQEPEIVAPGDAAFNASGWTAIREAS